MAAQAGSAPSRPVIGVTGNAKRLSPSWFCIQLGVRLAGGEPVRISLRHETDRARLHGLVISGGDDIHPSIYNAEEQGKAVYDPERDAMERDCIGYALERELPVLGICRGYQLLNAHCGGNLYNDILRLRKETSNTSTLLPRKTIHLAADSRIAVLLGTTRLKVNSLHHQAIDRVADPFRVVGRDLDNFAQALEHVQGREIMGVQWHPEYLIYQSRQRRFFRWLVEQARERAREVAA